MDFIGKFEIQTSFQAELVPKQPSFFVQSSQAPGSRWIFQAMFDDTGG